MTIKEFLDDRLGRSPVEKYLSHYRDELAQIDELGRDLTRVSQEELGRLAEDLHSSVAAGASPTYTRQKAFALAREAAARALGQRPYDVQILAGLALDDGMLAELATGEGKTLAAVAPVFLSALQGRGIHVLTFNDYLARRDAIWMGPIYESLGVSVRYVEASMSSSERRRAYAADVTYATAKEAGFDFLRGFLARDSAEVMHRDLYHAVIDEADSILIDEARVPMVIAGEHETSQLSPYEIARLVASLVEERDWKYDDDHRNVYLTDSGLIRLESGLGCDNLHDDAQYLLLTEINRALHAQTLLRKDVDYIVRDDRIELVDDFTGRVVPDRRWPDGLQAAIEAKEGVPIRPGGRVLGSITLQHFLARYERLGGMTATAVPAAEEILEGYGMKVAPIPSNRPGKRLDLPDRIYARRNAKESAIVEEIAAQHRRRRPVLVGTASVEESESLAALLHSEGISCNVLNAKHDDLEAEIIAEAGNLDGVTISTNMAGRGTDIRLGGVDGKNQSAVVELGGLFVIGTNRHESRRVDDQLRGRAGRQGDPGSTQFFTSLEDTLMVRFGIDDLIPPKLKPMESSDPLESKIIRREVDRLQRIVEGQNREIRKTLLKYARLVERQRIFTHAWRTDILNGAAPSILLQKAPTLHAELCRRSSEKQVAEAERLISLDHIDRAWAEHLALIAHIREGIHLVGIGGLDPLYEFEKTVTKAFNEMVDRIADEVVSTMGDLEILDGRVKLDEAVRTGPASTWTYVVSDQVAGELQRMLFGQGSAAFGAGAGLMTWPLIFVWGIGRRLKERRYS